MQKLTENIERSARAIFRLFFDSDIKVKNQITGDTASWGVDLLMECGGRKKLSLFMEEDTLKTVIKRLTGEDAIEDTRIAYDVMGEVARFIAGHALGENYDNFTLYSPVRSHGLKHSGLYRKAFSSNFGRFYIAIE